MIFSIRVLFQKEKMGKQIEKQEIPDTHLLRTDCNLVFSIDRNSRITKFNEECEKLFGYNKKEVLNKLITDFLIADCYLDQWNSLFEYSKNNKIIDNFVLPFLNKNGDEIIISWSNFPVKNGEGDIFDIGFVGYPIVSNNDLVQKLIEYPKSENDLIGIGLPVNNEKITENSSTIDVIKKMKKEYDNVDRRNKYLEKNIKYLKNRLDYYKRKQNEAKNHENHLGRSLYSLSELFGGKKKRQEFKNTVNELDERKKYLNKLETKLMNDKNKINEQMNELRTWREKLELLDNKLQEKWNEILERENLLLNKQTVDVIVDNYKEKNDKEYKEYNVVIDNIQDSAVVIHRGILKQVNDSFINLIGYNVDEIIDKSLFDFIVPEGFIQVEKFYLNRLKGDDISSYETIFLTKNNNKIPVEVNTKPTFFNGEKAEIAIVKQIKKEDKK